MYSDKAIETMAFLIILYYKIAFLKSSSCPFVKEKLYTFIIIIIISLFLKISLHPLEGLIW